MHITNDVRTALPPQTPISLKMLDIGYLRDRCGIWRPAGVPQGGSRLYITNDVKNGPGPPDSHPDSHTL